MGHIVLSIVVYGFLAFLLARKKPINAKIAITLGAVVTIVLIASSRLYLGAHWFSDVVASLSLGLAWVAVLAIAYMYHARDGQLSALPPILIVVATLALVEVSYVSGHYAEEAARYVYQRKSEQTSLGDWKDGGWKNQPFARSELGGEIEEPFSIQWVGSVGQIEDALAKTGWRAPQRWTLKTTLLWLLPGTTAEQLPVLPKFDHGEPQALTFVKVVNPRERAVIRLWPSGTVVPNADAASRSLWYGMVTIERVRHPGALMTLATAEPDYTKPVTLLDEDVRQRGLSVEMRERRGLPTLLVW